MYVGYAIEVNGKIFNSTTKDIFERAGDSKYFKKRLYIYPSELEEKAWLWSVGYEKATPNKLEANRILQSRCVIHYCTGGKGYYNGCPITPGMAFVSWKNMAHTIMSDPDDPFEFYWIMVRGEEVSSLVRDYSFTSDELIFNCDYMDQIIPIIESILYADYDKISLKHYANGMLQVLLSFQTSKKERQGKDVKHENDRISYANYIELAKNILYENNYALSGEQLSRMLGVTPQHLIRVFNRVLGESPKRYITRKRLALGKELLDKGVPSAEVAAILRYAEYTSFYRAFLKEYNVAPSDYSKNKLSK